MMLSLFSWLQQKMDAGLRSLDWSADRPCPTEHLTVIGTETQLLAYLRDLPPGRLPQLKILSPDPAIPMWLQGNICQPLNGCEAQALQELQALQKQGLITAETTPHLSRLLGFEALPVVECS